MKKICVHLFFAFMQHIKFQVLSSSGSLVLLPTKGVIKRRTDEQTDFFEVGGIKLQALVD